MSSHTVHLPYPDRAEMTVGSCECGWSITYRWGEHGDAAHDAGEHIRETTQSEPVETGTYAGDKTIIPGRSL